MSSQENKLRVLKRDSSRRYEEIYKPELQIGMDYIPSLDKKEEFLKLSLELGHVPMKKESKEIRKIMSEKGLTKNEVCSNKSYSRKIKEHEKTKVIYNDIEKHFIKSCKKAMVESGLPIWSPKTLEILKYNLESEVIHYLAENPHLDFSSYYYWRRERDTMYDYLYLQTNHPLTNEAINYKKVLDSSDKRIIKDYILLIQRKKKN